KSKRFERSDNLFRNCLSCAIWLLWSADSRHRKKYFAQNRLYKVMINVRKLLYRDVYFHKFGKVIFQSSTETASFSPKRQEMPVERELNQVRFLLAALAEFVVDDFELVFGVKPNRVDLAGNFDCNISHWHTNIINALLGR